MEIMKLHAHKYANCGYYHTMYLAGKMDGIMNGGLSPIQQGSSLCGVAV